VRTLLLAEKWKLSFYIVDFDNI